MDKPQPKENPQRIETTQRMQTVSSVALFLSVGKIFAFFLQRLNLQKNNT